MIIFVFSLMALLDEEYVIVLLGALAIAVVIFGISAVAKGAETTTYHRAIIYDMDSFDHGRYEITEVEGRIFTIIDKEAGRE